MTIIAVIMIFINAIGWLDWIYNFLKNNWNASYVAAVVLMIIIIGFMFFITKDPKSKDDGEKK